MRCSFVTASVSRRAGGIYDACRCLAQELMTLECEVIVHGVYDDYTAEDQPAWSPVPLQISKVSFPYVADYSPTIRNELFQSNSDILHSHGMWNYPSWISFRWRNLTGKPEVIHPHGMLDPWALKQAKFKKKLALALFERSHLSKASCLRALNQSELKAIRNLGIRSPICVIPNGIEMPPQELMIPKSEKNLRIILYLGRIHPKKGLNHLLEGWQQYISQFTSTTECLIIAGWDQENYEQELIQQCKDHGILHEICHEKDSSSTLEAGRIYFFGPRFRQQKSTLFQRCSSFILPSLSEGQPMAVLEAWSYGKPVLMTKMCNLLEGFSSNAAISIKPDAASIADSLKIIHEMSERELSAMGTNGRNLVARIFTWEKVAQMHQQVHEWLLNRTLKPEFVITD